MYPKLIFFGTSPRVAYASVQPFNESIYIPDAPNAIIPIGSQSFVFSRATLLNRDFVTFWIMELIWCIGCGVLLTRKKLLITTWQHNRMAFFFLFVLNGINGMIFLYTQPPVWDYFPRKTQERNEYYRKSLFDSQNSFAEQNVKTRANTLHQVFILPQNSNGAAFQWIEISPFEYLYHISEKPESVLPYSDKGISITNEGSGFYKVTYWQERLLWHWGLLPGCILVWCIILWSIQAALKVLMESKKYLKA